MKKRYSGYLGLFLITMIFLLLSQYYLEYYFYKILDLTVYPTYNFGIKWKLVIDLLSNISLNILAFVGGSVTVLIKHWIISNKEISRLEQQQLEAEVIHLKEQAGPDFLFETMNHIGLLEDKNPDLASWYLLKLCRLLRYQLYDGNMDQVFLTSEIKYISDYLELKQLIYPNMIFEIKRVGELIHTLIPPLLFIPFIQQIIRYIPDKNTVTSISLVFTMDTDNLYFSCITGFDHPITHEDLQQIIHRIRLLFAGNYDLYLNEKTNTGLIRTGLRLGL